MRNIVLFAGPIVTVRTCFEFSTPKEFTKNTTQKFASIMEVESNVNIDTDAFLPPAGRQQSKASGAGKKRSISTTGGDEEMHVDEATGIEGKRKTNAPKAKRKRPAAVETRKVPVPPHRYCA